MKEQEQKLAEKFIEVITKDYNHLNMAKKMAADCKAYELGAMIRKIEIERFSDAALNEYEYEVLSQMQTAISMTGIDASLKAIYIIYNVILGFRAKGYDFNLRDAEAIKANADKYFYK